MIWAASSTDVSGLADCGSRVIHADTTDAERFSPDAAARRISRSVRIPCRKRPCRTMAEPTLASAMPAAAAVIDVSAVTATTRVFMRSRSAVTAVVFGDRRLSATAAYLIQLAVVRAARPVQLLGQHSPQRAGPCREVGPFLPEHLEGRLVELSMGTLWGDRIPDLLEAVNQVEELVGDVIHGTTLRATCKPRPRQRRGRWPGPALPEPLSVLVWPWLRQSGRSGCAEGTHLTPDQRRARSAVSPPNGFTTRVSRLDSLTVFVLERDLELGAVGDRPALVDMDVLLYDLGDPKIADRLPGGPYRLGGGLFPRSAAGADDVDHFVHAHDGSSRRLLDHMTAEATLAGVSTLLRAIGGAHRRLVADREADRAGDEAQRADLVVQRLCLFRHRPVSDRHCRAEYHLGELAAAARRVHHHRADRGVGVVGDDHSPVRAQMQVPQHVALSERGDQQFLRVPAGGVAAEGGVGRAEDGRLALAVNIMIAAVAAVMAGPRAGVPRPPDSHFIAVRDSHCNSLWVYGCTGVARSSPGHGWPAFR